MSGNTLLGNEWINSILEPFLIEDKNEGESIERVQICTTKTSECATKEVIRL